ARPRLGAWGRGRGLFSPISCYPLPKIGSVPWTRVNFTSPTEKDLIIHMHASRLGMHPQPLIEGTGGLAKQQGAGKSIHAGGCCLASFVEDTPRLLLWRAGG